MAYNDSRNTAVPLRTINERRRALRMIHSSRPKPQNQIVSNGMERLSSHIAERRCCACYMLHKTILFLGRPPINEYMSHYVILVNGMPAVVMNGDLSPRPDIGYLNKYPLERVRGNVMTTESIARVIAT